MRILSQCSNIDIPYEEATLNIDMGGTLEKGREICIYSRTSSVEKVFVMARYKTLEKARKAMEMLHGAYCGVVYMKHADYEIADIDLSQELEKKIREEMMKPHFLDVKINNPVIECKVFRFPADDEVEV